MTDKQRVTVTDIAAVLVSDFGMTKSDAKAAINAVFSYIQQKVDAGYSVGIKNFGIFYQKHYSMQSGQVNDMISLRPSKKNQNH